MATSSNWVGAWPRATGSRSISAARSRTRIWCGSTAPTRPAVPAWRAAIERPAMTVRPPWLALAPVVIVAGCAAGPNYHRPDVHAPGQYAATAVPAPPGAAPAPDLATWWHALQDPVLDSLVERAVKANPDVEIALSRLQAART